MLVLGDPCIQSLYTIQEAVYDLNFKIILGFLLCKHICEYTIYCIIYSTAKKHIELLEKYVLLTVPLLQVQI
ncbi:hypothetical protein BpHYR1_050632 [Brachionus plicatilis]|uniref:Uncharacterized protein n=1 Tax=Brachionus plicatilis TaxID=10195 RepID=A0A3M7P5C8_BRAPC|nr:hypothetical protein BpHYR1_050632 [Brachionus plicatilis]